jgi:hypothetical protein
VSGPFFYDDDLTHDAPPGPFASSCEWLQTCAGFVITDQERKLNALNHEVDKTSDIEDEIEEAQTLKKVAEELAAELPNAFPQNLASPETTVLFHYNLDENSIMVDDQGKLTAISSWEFVSAVPQWYACQYPSLLQGRTREDKPDRTGYAPYSEDDYAPGCFSEDTLYWEHLLQYEMTQLREVFVEEIEKLIPDWTEVRWANSTKADIVAAIQYFDGPILPGAVIRRLKAYRQGNGYSLCDWLEGFYRPFG